MIVPNTEPITNRHELDPDESAGTEHYSGGRGVWVGHCARDADAGKSARWPTPECCKVLSRRCCSAGSGQCARLELSALAGPRHRGPGDLRQDIDRRFRQAGIAIPSAARPACAQCGADKHHGGAKRARFPTGDVRSASPGTNGHAVQGDRLCLQDRKSLMVSPERWSAYDVQPEAPGAPWEPAPGRATWEGGGTLRSSSVGAYWHGIARVVLRTARRNDG